MLVKSEPLRMLSQLVGAQGDNDRSSTQLLGQPPTFTLGAPPNTQHPAPTAPRLNPLLPCCVTSLLTFNVFVFGVTSDMLCLCLCRFHSNCLRILSSDCFPRPATNCWGWVRVRVPKKGWCTYKNVGWVQKVAYNCINMQISEPKRGGDGWPALTHCRPQCQRVSPDRQTAAAHLPLSTLSQHS